MVLYYFLSGISSKGGIERISIQKANYLVELGFSVSIVVLGTGNDIPAYPISSKINYIQIQKHPASSIKQKIREVFRLKDIIANIIKDADVVVSANCVLISWILPFIQRKVPKLLELHFSYEGLQSRDVTLYNGNKLKCFLHNTCDI